MKRKTNQQIAALTNRTTFRVRFSEIDSMQIVWHGEYVRYFEDGREAFGKQYVTCNSCIQCVFVIYHFHVVYI